LGIRRIFWPDWQRFLDSRSFATLYFGSNVNLFLIAIFAARPAQNVRRFGGRGTKLREVLTLLLLTKRWYQFPRQFGGLANMNSGFDYAADFSCSIGRPASERGVRSIGEEDTFVFQIDTTAR
jgi:hypothetical protein